LEGSERTGSIFDRNSRVIKLNEPVRPGLEVDLQGSIAGLVGKKDFFRSRSFSDSVSDVDTRWLTIRPAIDLFGLIGGKTQDLKPFAVGRCNWMI
jgi:hypothetical protein